MRRNQKICKIVNEISYFLLEEYADHLNIDIKEADNDTILIFTFGECEESDINELKEIFVADRDSTVEEYGWELVGDDDSDYNKELLASVIDEANVYSIDHKTVIRLVRHE